MARDRIGEVMEAATSEFTVQRCRLYEAPAVGSLVLCGERVPVYGVVCDATTQSIDRGRVAVPRGMDAASEADVLRSNPQLDRLLCARFRAVAVGFQEGGAVWRYPPLIAPRLYSFVRECDSAEIREFSSSHEHLQTLLDASTGGVTDFVVAAFLRQVSTAYPDARAYLLSAGKVLALALREQVPRLSRILASAG